MFAGPPLVYFHPQSEFRESRVGRDAARDRSGRPAPAPFWIVPHSPSANRPSEMESMYAHPPYAGGGSMQHHHVSAGTASPPSALQPPQRIEMWSASAHSHGVAAVAAVPFPGPTGHALEARRFPDVAVRQFDCSRPGLNPFRVSLGNPQSLGNVNAPNHDIAGPSALGFIPGDQAWEEMLGTAFAPRAHSSLPPQVCSWEPNEPTRIQSPCLIGNDTSSVEPAHPQNADDDDVCTFPCEWTDEHGTCNMDILGDRAWMNHHLSRHHNVVGHEKSQRACLWRGCTDTMNKGSLARHVVSRHLRAGASCGFCSKVYSRADVARRHTKKCKVANGASVQHDQTKW